MGNKSVKHNIVKENICNLCNNKIAKYKIKSNIMIHCYHNICLNCINIEKNWLNSINMYHTFIIINTY